MDPYCPCYNIMQNHCIWIPAGPGQREYVRRNDVVETICPKSFSKQEKQQITDRIFGKVTFVPQNDLTRVVIDRIKELDSKQENGSSYFFEPVFPLKK